MEPKVENASGNCTVWRFRLYVAGSAPNSMRAIANLNKLFNHYMPGRFDIEIVDILEDPLQAIHDGIWVTPSLVKISPEPAVKVVGDLDEHERVKRVIGLDERDRRTRQR